MQERHEMRKIKTKQLGAANRATLFPWFAMVAGHRPRSRRRVAPSIFSATPHPPFIEPHLLADEAYVCPQMGIREEALILATVSPDPGFHSDVRAALDARFRFEAVWDLRYEDAARLQGVKSDQKCLNVIDFRQPDHALPVIRTLSGRPQITTIAVGCAGDREELLLLMQTGVRDVLPHFTSRELLQAANRALLVLGTAGEILADLYAFVPAKPGCGASTIATYATGMASRLTDEPTLLLDFDIRLGVTTFLLKAEGTRSIVDALEQVDRLDRDMWSGLVSQIDNLHLLGSGAADFAHTFLAEHFRQLLDYAVREYSVVTVDLPGSMEDHECDVLLRAKRILLVCTPDIGALHVARRKSQWFRDLKLTDKVSVVVNCVERRGTLSLAEIERIIQLPVRYPLPIGAKDISKAVHKGEILDPDCPLGRQIAVIAADMVPVKSVIKKSSPMRRFVEYFSVSPARDTRSA
jgi:pilus assembly protein CpaE